MKNYLSILVVLCLFVSCKKNNGYKDSDPTLFKEYITGFTSGLISTEEPIEVLLTESLDIEQIENIDTEKVFEFSPKVDGYATFEGNSVKFVPREPLSYNKEYQVIFNLSQVLNVKKEQEKFFFRVRTQNLLFEVNTRDLQSYSPDYYFLNAQIEASDKLSPEMIPNMVFATIGGKRLQVKALSSEAAKEMPIVIDSIPSPEEGSQLLEIRWDGGAYDITSKGEASINIPKNDSFGVVQLLQNEGENNSFNLVFSAPIEKNQDFRGLVTVENYDSQFKYSTSGNILKVYSDVNFDNEVKIKVYQGIKSQYGDRMKYDFSGKLTFDPIKPQVRLVRNGTLLPSSQNLKINFQTINLRAVEVSVLRIYQNNVLQFLQENDLNGASRLRRVGATIARKQIPIQSVTKNSLSKWSTHALDLSKLIKPEPGAIYRVKIDFKREYALNCNPDNTPIKEENLLIAEEGGDSDYYDYDEYYYYDWDERDDPCTDSYYYNKAVETNVLATDLGVVVKRGQEDDYTVVVNDLLSTAPVAGAKVELYDYQQQKLSEASTNAEGIAFVKTSKQAYFAIARKNNNTTYVKINDGASQSVSSYDVGGLELEKGRNGYLYTERGVWRPGDSISVGFIFNDYANKLPERLPIKLTFSDPNGKVMQQIVKNSNPQNHYLFTLHTHPEALTGNWSCQVNVGASTYSKTIKIETIKPNRLKINNSLTDKFISNQGQNATLQVDWLQGVPANEVKVIVTGKLYPKSNPFKGYESYTFHNTSFPPTSQEISVFEGQTDEKGSASFFFQPKKLQNASQMLKVNFLTQANEQGGDFSTDVTSATYSPYASYVGIKPLAPNTEDYQTGKVTKFQTLVVSEEGKPIAGRKVKLLAYKVEKSWWWDVSEYNISTYNSSPSQGLAFTKEATTHTDGKATFDIQIKDDQAGRYFFLVEDTESQHEAGIAAYFYSWGQNDEDAGKDATMLMLSTDKKEYKVGEKVLLTFPSDQGGRALISVENGSKVLKTYWVNTQKGKTTYHLPITSNMAPNVYLYVTLLQPHAQTKNDAPIRLYGIAPISVYDPKTRLEPIIEMPEVLRPEKQVTIKVREKTGKPMTYSLAIVEDGLLDLTRFRTPNPWNTFFTKTALGVRTWDIYNDVIGAFGGTINQVFSIGGDEDLGAGQAKKANRFKPLTIVQGPFYLPSGVKSHKINIPNYVGSARVMVIASDVQHNAFGSVEKTVPVTSPLMVLASLSRKAVPGEEITLPITVFATEPQIKNVTVRVKTNEKFSLQGQAQQQVTFTAPAEKMAYFSLKVNEIGIGKITVEAVSGNEKAVYDVEMDVYNPNPKIYQVKSLILQPNTSGNISFEAFGEKGTGESILEVSSFPGVNLAQRLKYLIEYPHGCGEQLTSGAFPQLYLADFETLSLTQQQEVQKNVTAAIRKVSENQLPNGGFSYWQGLDYADEWVTSYIGQFYIEAERKGFALPSGSKTKWIAYQKTLARNWTPNGSNAAFNQAYRLYTLALAKSPDIASMNRLREASGLSGEALSRLAAAYAIAGEKKAAEELFKRVTFDTETENNYGYGSSLRNQAMSLETALLLGKSQIAAELALKISEKLSSQEWLSTQTTAYSLYAMALYVAKNKAGKAFSLVYQSTTDNGTLTSGNTGMTTKKLNVAQGNHKLSLQNKSAITLYARVVTSGILPIGKELIQQNGLAIQTSFSSDKNGNLSVESLPQGTSFVAKISVTNTTQSAISNVALTQFIPSGWEVINTRFTDYGDQNDKWDYADIRDDRALIYFGLGAGKTKTFTLKLNASYKGKYYLSGTYAEAMYDKNYNTHTTGKWIKIE